MQIQWCCRGYGHMYRQFLPDERHLVFSRGVLIRSGPGPRSCRSPICDGKWFCPHGPRWHTQFLGT